VRQVFYAYLISERDKDFDLRLGFFRGLLGSLLRTNQVVRLLFGSPYQSSRISQPMIFSWHHDNRISLDGITS
jgi:hypothetical protein